jgi:phage tail-like protein
MTMTSWLDPALYPPNVTPPTSAPVSTPPAPVSRTGQPEFTITGLRFHVVIDGQDLGDWAKVEGLSVKFELAEYRAGDGGNHRWIEPTFTTFTDVKLSRAVTLASTLRTKQWLEKMCLAPKKVTGQITAYAHWHKSHDTAGAVTWNLRGVLPVAWTGPQFDANANAVATETLELAHDGWLDE